MKSRECAAKSIGDLFQDKLQEMPVVGRIHSVFAAVINLELDGNLYCLGKSKIGNGPCTILLAPLADDFNHEEFKPGSPVLFGPESIEIGDLTVKLSDVEVYNSRYQSNPNPEAFFPILPQLKDLVVREGNLKGLGILLHKREDYAVSTAPIEHIQRTLIEEAAPLVSKLRESLMSGADSFWGAVQQLVGLGPGLTPAGDDFLTGFLLTCRYLESGGYLQLPTLDLQEFAVQVKLDTNLISATEVILAAQGRPFELIRDLLENLFNGRKVHTILNALRLMDQGNTSGTDILTGIIFAGEIFQEKIFLESGL